MKAQKRNFTMFLLFFALHLYGQGNSYFTVTEVGTPNGPEYHCIPDYVALQNDYPLGAHSFAAYRFFWIFGDGTFSFEDEPVHQYADGGNYEITMSATPVYSPNEPPPTTEMVVPNIGSNSSAAGISFSGALSLKKNRRPSANYPNIYIITYQNITGTTISNGEVYFHYNSLHFTHKKDYLQNNQVFTSQSTYSGGNYDTRRTYSLGTLAPNETRIIFIEMNATQATAMNGNFPSLYIKAELLSNGTAIANVEEVGIAASGWDPNYVSFDPNQIVYEKWPVNEEIIFRVDFENDGTSVVTDVSVSSIVSDLLDFSTLALVDYFPNNVTPTFSTDLTTRTFTCSQSGITLQGTRDPDPGVSDGTSGYYLFSVDLLDQSNYDPLLFGGAQACEPYLQIEGEAEVTMDLGTAIPTRVSTVDFYEDDILGCDQPIPPVCNLEISIFPDPVSLGSFSILVESLPFGYDPNAVTVEFVEIWSANPASNIVETGRYSYKAGALLIEFNNDGATPGLYDAVVEYPFANERCNELFEISF